MEPLNQASYDYLLDNDPELKALLEEWADIASYEFKNEVLAHFEEIEREYEETNKSQEETRSPTEETTPSK